MALTAVVTPVGGGPQPTGAVFFRDGGALLGSVALAGGRAVFRTRNFSVGLHGISAAYAGDSGPLHYDSLLGSWVGGMFWDGRADSLEDQAQGPVQNPIEMTNEEHAWTRTIARVRAKKATNG